MCIRVYGKRTNDYWNGGSIDRSFDGTNDIPTNIVVIFGEFVLVSWSLIVKWLLSSLCITMRGRTSLRVVTVPPGAKSFAQNFSSQLSHKIVERTQCKFQSSKPIDVFRHSLSHNWCKSLTISYKIVKIVKVILIIWWETPWYIVSILSTCIERAQQMV